MKKINLSTAILTGTIILLSCCCCFYYIGQSSAHSSIQFEAAMSTKLIAKLTAENDRLSAINQQKKPSADLTYHYEEKIFEQKSPPPQLSAQTCQLAGNFDQNALKTHSTDDINQLLAQYKQLPAGPLKDSLRESIRSLSAAQAKAIQHHLVNAIVNSPNDSETIELYHELYGYQKNDQDMNALVAVLPEINNDKALASAIKLTTAFSASSLDKNEFNALYGNYFYSPSPLVQEAILTTLHDIERDDEVELLTKALSLSQDYERDNSYKTLQQTALDIIDKRQLISPEITEQLHELSVNGQSHRTRSHAASLLFERGETEG